ncbi:DUF1707 SHOCT-like domain-containing protein [Brevibacterium spongiae]|uniref:DUF1707 domain-containing protein n=1 Tax=Brevibacterium spongiae TaxID=2909672 RepID=A0ABY5SS33_9MICO|nr:DUF1707 domain-containing protein [Brevibacterium spongiae]UVI37004.1 DUF1707 domain-containing protein [Brevibacterium spongiae]
MTLPDPSSHENDPAKTFRIGHRERDDAIEVLREAAGDGRITVDELDERMEKVQAAKFPIDLDEVLGDLVTELPSDRFRPTSAIAPASGRGQAIMGHDRFDPLVIKAGWESEVRRAKWAVPPFIRCEPSMSSIELNFLEVDTDLQTIEVEIVAGMGSVTVVIPEDWAVNVDELSKSWGSVKSVVNAVPTGRKPIIRVGGSIGMGSFKARFANYFDRRRLAR